MISKTYLKCKPYICILYSYSLIFEFLFIFLMITIPDYYNIDSLLSEEERLIRDTVRSFVDSEIIPIIEDHYQAGTAPEGMIKD